MTLRLCWRSWEVGRFRYERREIERGWNELLGSVELCRLLPSLHLLLSLLVLHPLAANYAEVQMADEKGGDTIGPE